MFSIIVSTIFNTAFGAVKKKVALSCRNYKFVIILMTKKER
jgi:hypothetical protein